VRSLVDGAFARLAKLAAAETSAWRVAEADLASYRLGAVASADLSAEAYRASRTRDVAHHRRPCVRRARIRRRHFRRRSDRTGRPSRSEE